MRHSGGAGHAEGTCATYELHVLMFAKALVHWQALILHGRNLVIYLPIRPASAGHRADPRPRIGVPRIFEIREDLGMQARV